MTNLSMDRILIKDLLARCIIGVGDEERRERQDVIINLALATEARKAARTDKLEDAVDYRQIKKQVLDAVEHSEYHLIETLAERIAALCLENPGVKQVWVSVEKPSALRFARGVAVEITRGSDTE